MLTSLAQKVLQFVAFDGGQIIWARNFNRFVPWLCSTSRQLHPLRAYPVPDAKPHAWAYNDLYTDTLQQIYSSALSACSHGCEADFTHHLSQSHPNEVFCCSSAPTHI